MSLASLFSSLTSDSNFDQPATPSQTALHTDTALQRPVLAPPSLHLAIGKPLSNLLSTLFFPSRTIIQRTRRTSVIDRNEKPPTPSTLHALIRITAFSLLEETQHVGGSKRRQNRLRSHHWRPFCAGHDFHRLGRSPFLPVVSSAKLTPPYQLAWLIAFISSIIANVQDLFPKYAWWTVAYMLCCILGVAFVFATNSSNIYSIAVCTRFLSHNGKMLMCLGCWISRSRPCHDDLGRQLSRLPATRCHGGCSCRPHLAFNGSCKASDDVDVGSQLIVTQIIWIFYFGSAPQAAHREFIDQFALHKEANGFRGPTQNMTNAYDRPQTTSSAQPPQMYTSAQLNGFETSSPVSGYPGGPAGAARASAQPMNTSSTPAPGPEVAPPTEYPYRAKAIYSYEANPDDANEISFSKHEILEVSDVSGRWWQAKKENGETGIAPSNYLILL